jgi:hypothetical protein
MGKGYDYMKYNYLKIKSWDPYDRGVYTAWTLEKVSAFELSMLEAEAVNAAQSAEKFKKFLDKIKRLGGEIRGEGLAYYEFARNPTLRGIFLRGFIDGIRDINSQGSLNVFKIMRW